MEISISGITGYGDFFFYFYSHSCCNTKKYTISDFSKRKDAASIILVSHQKLSILLIYNLNSREVLKS